MKTLLLLLPFLISGCATNKKSIFASIAVSSAASAVLGKSNAPKGENPNSHALLWAGIGGTLSALAATQYFDSEKELERKTKELNQLKLNFQTYKEDYGPKLINKNNSKVSSKKLPSVFSSIIQGGSWEHYKIDRIVKDESEEGTYYRQTEMIKVDLPQLLETN